MPVPQHLNEGDYGKLFPDDVDEFPTPINEEHYIDAWLLNTAFNSILLIEAYLLEHKDNIEAPIGDDILGIEGYLEITIPAARYPAYKTAMAWDSNLLAENIKKNETIFGIVGTLVAMGAGVSVAVPSIDATGMWVFPSIPGQNLNLTIISVAVPTVAAT